MQMSAVKEAIADAERFVKKAKKLEVYTCYDGTKLPKEAEIGVRAAACKRASMDLTRSLAKMRRS
jgi:hypothetical protein